MQLFRGTLAAGKATCLGESSSIGDALIIARIQRHVLLRQYLIYFKSSVLSRSNNHFDLVEGSARCQFISEPLFRAHDGGPTSRDSHVAHKDDELIDQRLISS